MSIQSFKGAIFYQIYPRSFHKGTLNGTTEKLDYIASLGVDGIWICPFFKSPMKDFGYDVSDYRAIDPQFGTMDDFDRLLARAHELNLKIIIDLVLSHTSDQHEWFATHPEYYVWADPSPHASSSGLTAGPHDEHENPTAKPQDDNKRRIPPNNWVSIFGGPAWTWHEGRGQYYLHNFLPDQPDLNFHNPDVQCEALDIAKFWLERGVDGFRLDVVNFYFHDKQLRDNPPRDASLGAATQFEGSDPYSAQSHIHDKSQPENLAFLKRFQALCESYGAFTIGEIGDDHPYERTAEYTGEGLLDTCYNPQMMSGTQKDLTAALIREPFESLAEASTTIAKQNFDLTRRKERRVGKPTRVTQQQSQGEVMAGYSYPSWAFSNHDVVRAASRWLPDSDGFSHDPRLSKMLITLLGSLYGTLFLYQGEELGLPEAKLKYEDLQDPWGKHLYPKWQGRDGCRTPMPWDETTLTEKHWLPIPDSHHTLTAATQEKEQNSPLNFTRRFLHWRKDQSPLTHGNIQFIKTNDESLLAFTRTYENKTMLCLFNLNGKDTQIPTSLRAKQSNPSPALTDRKDAGLLRRDAPRNDKTLKPYGFSLSSEETSFSFSSN
ncbi:MAG: alpha-amylase family glycosyl hydrolase [Alphaproteobacteria bacterium]